MARQWDSVLPREESTEKHAQLKVEMRKEIQRVHKRLGKPTIYVTHDQEEAITMSDRIVVLNDGEIKQVGRPTNTFVASFVGNPTINYLDGTIENVDEDAVTLSIGEGSLRPPLDNVDAVTAGDPVQVGIRPQSVSLSSDLESAHFEAEIFLLEPVNDRGHATLDGPAGEFRAILSSMTNVHEEQTLGLRLTRPHCTFLSPTRGSCLRRPGRSKRTSPTQ